MTHTWTPTSRQKQCQAKQVFPSAALLATVNLPRAHLTLYFGRVICCHALSSCMHIHTQQNKMFFCEVLATHQNQDDKFETNISILVGDCHIVATSNSCCVSVLYKHSTSVLLTRFRARLPYEDFRKKTLLTAQALPPAAGHPEVSGQTGLSLLLRRGRGERRRAALQLPWGRASRPRAPAPTSTTGGH